VDRHGIRDQRRRLQPIAAPRPDVTVGAHDHIETWRSADEGAVSPSLDHGARECSTCGVDE
jgi:hypothetical protein